MAFNQGCKGLVPNDSLHYKFLYYYLLSNVGFLNELGTGATFKELSATRLKAVTIHLPPLAEQKRIVAVLDEAFAGIAAAVANAEKNLANARKLFESHLNAVLTQKGDGWVERTISEIGTLKSGTTVPKSKERAEGDIPYVKVADMSLPENECGVTTSTRFLRAKDVSVAKIFPVGTTIFPKRGGAIATNKKRLTQVPVCADLNIMGVIPGPDLLPELLFNYFRRFDLASIGSGSSIPQINNYDIRPLVIHYPQSKEVQHQVIDELRHLYEQSQHLASNYKRKLKCLAELKQSILHKAFTGELTAAAEGRQAVA